jgi:hypothetical protein
MDSIRNKTSICLKKQQPQAAIAEYKGILSNTYVASWYFGGIIATRKSKNI